MDNFTVGAPVAGKIPPTIKGAAPDKLRETAQDFESVFVFQVLDTMYQGLGTDGLFGGGQAEKMFRSIMNEEIAKSISAHGGFGIGKAVYGELLKLQEMHNVNGPV